MKIENLTISNDCAPLVVPEIGINHGGSLEVAKLMVDAAARAGAKIVKHQTHIVEDEMSKEAQSVIPGNAKISIYEIMKKCALSVRDERELKEYSEKKGLVYLSTPFSRAGANALMDMGVSAFKIGSGECNNFPLITHIAKFKKPMIISTGMNHMQDIEQTVNILRAHEIEFALLHTTNLYPTPERHVRLKAMLELAKFGVPFGLSDHTTSNLACLGAVALGASILERHFTDVMSRQGPDIVCSMDENALKELITQSELMRQMRGDGAKKEAASDEQVTIDFAFASVVSIREIRAGEKLNMDNIWVKRPGKGGIHARHFDEILGKTATRDIEADKQLKWEDFA